MKKYQVRLCEYSHCATAVNVASFSFFNKVENFY